jgi:hypothetical protein
MRPILNSFRDRAISLYTVQTSNMQCPHTSFKVHGCWWNFRKCIILGKLYQLCHLNSTDIRNTTEYRFLTAILELFPITGL